MMLHGRRCFSWIVAASLVLLAAASTNADPTYFLPRCGHCHSDDTPTCSGCHAHVAGGLKAQTGQLHYPPGGTVTVTLSSWGWPGWVRATLYDENGIEIDRVTGPTGKGDDGSGDPTLQLPVVLSGPAPTTIGLYTWSVGWFGSVRQDSGDLGDCLDCHIHGGPGSGGESFHTEDVVVTNEFWVDPSASTSTTTTSTTSSTTTPSTTTSTTSSTGTTATTSPPTTSSPTTTTSTTTSIVTTSTTATTTTSTQTTTSSTTMTSTTSTPTTTTSTIMTSTTSTPTTTTSTTMTTLPPLGTLDHFLCYKTTARQAITVQLSDQLDTGSYEGKVAKLFCVPADKNAEGIVDPDTHLTSYRIRGPHVRRTDVLVTNQFGTFSYDTKRTYALMLPSTKSIAPEPPPGLPNPASTVDHYRCVKVRTTKGTPKIPKGMTADVRDQFGDTRTFSIRKASTLCLPTDKNGEGIGNPDAYLMCYKGAALLRHSASGVQVRHQLGDAVLQLKKEAELCVPSVTDLSPSTTTTTPSTTTTVP